MRGDRAIDPQPRVDCVVQQVDDQVDEDEDEGDQAQIRAITGMSANWTAWMNSSPIPRPLEHRLGDDRRTR
jgi:hypothetical protein